MTHAQLQNLAISETGFVFDPRTGATFTLNPAGLTVLVALRDGLALDGIVARVHERFEAVPAGSARQDVVEFVQLLRQHGLVPASFTV
jgi:hypothetical protein